MIELQPSAQGNTDIRPDWTPHAQPVDATTGIMAHTPDPTSYHDAGSGRTMIPRSTMNGASRGFSHERPGVLNVITGYGASGLGAQQSFTIDLEKVSADRSEQAFHESGGDSLTALAKLSQEQVVPVQPAPAAQGAWGATVVPQTEPGYVVPHAASGGSQVEQSPAAAALGNGSHAPVVGKIENPSVKPPGGPMPVPEVFPHPQANPVVQPTVTTDPGVVPAGNTAVSLPQPTIPQQASPTPDQYMMPQMLGMMQGMMQQLQQLQAPAAVPQKEAMPVEEVDALRHEVERLRQELLTDKKATNKYEDPRQNPAEFLDEEEDELAVPQTAGLPWLTDPPSPPKVQVIFNMGQMGGQHFKRFHAVTHTGLWLSLVYDTRFEFGDQFIPPPTGDDGEPITIHFPEQNSTVRAVVPDGCNMRIGCMDIINFIVKQDPQQPPTDGTLQLPTGGF